MNHALNSRQVFSVHSSSSEVLSNTESLPNIEILPNTSILPQDIMENIQLQDIWESIEYPFNEISNSTESLSNIVTLTNTNILPQGIIESIEYSSTIQILPPNTDNIPLQNTAIVNTGLTKELLAILGSGLGLFKLHPKIVISTVFISAGVGALSFGLYRYWSSSRALAQETQTLAEEIQKIKQEKQEKENLIQDLRSEISNLEQEVDKKDKTINQLLIGEKLELDTQFVSSQIQQLQEFEENNTGLRNRFSYSV